LAGRGEIVRAVREEMAVKLTDIVFRRTELGAAPGPERTAVEEAARVAGTELGWDPTRQEMEVTSVMREIAVPSPILETVG
jgi:glycerol-3-phosphate dehydrogenase